MGCYSSKPVPQQSGDASIATPKGSSRQATGCNGLMSKVCAHYHLACRVAYRIELAVTSLTRILLQDTLPNHSGRVAITLCRQGCCCKH